MTTMSVFSSLTRSTKRYKAEVEVGWEPVSIDWSTHAQALYVALDEYAVNNGGHYPDSLEVLVTPDENGATYLGRLGVLDLSLVYLAPTDGRSWRLVA